MKKIYAIVLFVILLSCKDNSSVSSANIVSINASNPKNTAVENYFSSPEIPGKMTFAGEQIPLDDRDVKEKLDYEMIVNNFWHSNTILMMKRANRWFPLITSIFKEEKLPQDLVYIALIESGLRNVTSPAGAKGFWQIMETTGKEYGLRINHEVDERNDVEKSTRVAAAYLKNAYQKLNSWTLAAAAYNRGMSGIERDQKRQGLENYFDLSLNNETARYVYRILAIKLIFENPEKYGFYLKKEDLYPPYITKKVAVDSSITNVYEWARKQGSSIKIVRKLNPWMIGNTLEVKEGEVWDIKLPENKKQFRIIGE